MTYHKFYNEQILTCFCRAQNPKATDQDLNDTFQVNVVGNIRLFNIFLPLIRNGRIKKVVTISSGNALIDLTVNYELTETPPYSISKAAMNMVVAKFQAEFKKEGIMFMAVCPGAVNTGQFDSRTYRSVCPIRNY
jgi:NAD(P)-dependent dehydrogenase (short-subunit alcohol dehydrogenase family)